MRLLPRSEIDAAKTLDRQREIAEGTKLAAKVDTLRELYAEEEKSLGEFRIRTIGLIRGELDVLKAQETALLSHISTLEVTRKALQEPLDDEWAKVNNTKTTLDLIKIELITEERTLNKTKMQLLAQAEEQEKERQRIDDERARGKELLSSSGTMYEDAKETLAEAQTQAATLGIKWEKKTHELTLREQAVAARERDVALKTELFTSKEENLSDRERALADKYATLERTIKRYGSNKRSIQ